MWEFSFSHSPLIRFTVFLCQESSVKGTHSGVQRVFFFFFGTCVIQTNKVNLFAYFF